jgi:flagellar protein FliL
MPGKLFPILLALVGLGCGIGTGIFLRPATGADDHAVVDASGGHATEDENATDGGHATDGDAEHAEPDESAPEYVKMNNQFVVPVVDEGRVAAMVVLTLSLEVEAGNTEMVYQHEPKLRDAFLQVMFDHANTGGFNGTFTDGSNLVVLRTSLKEAAGLVLGTIVGDVLITDIARQDS